jgi:tetratricopeptide (TPR) repeat protein
VVPFAATTASRRLAAAYFYWAYVLATQKGETQAGCDRFRRALELVPGMLHARYNLGDALLHLGEVQPAIHTVKRRIILRDFCFIILRTQPVSSNEESRKQLGR